MSHPTNEQNQDWIADHDYEVIERYIEDCNSKEFSRLVCELLLHDKEFKEALIEAVIRSPKLLEKAQNYYAELGDEGPEREDYGGDR